jgi:hypothetical protein
VDPISFLQSLGVGILSYSSLFVLLATWVFMDATLRGIRPGPPATATLILGWMGLAAYLVRRSRLQLEPVPVLARESVPIDLRG